MESKQKVLVETSKRCDKCGGTGVVQLDAPYGPFVDCRSCNGTGRVPLTQGEREARAWRWHRIGLIHAPIKSWVRVIHGQTWGKRLWVSAWACGDKYGECEAATDVEAIEAAVAALRVHDAEWGQDAE